MKKNLYSLLLIFGLVLGIASVQSEEVIIGDEFDDNATVTYVTLLWDSQPKIVGYNVYYGRESGDYSRIKTVTTPAAIIGVKGNKPVYFAVTAYTEDGIESDLSNEVSLP